VSLKIAGPLSRAVFVKVGAYFLCVFLTMWLVEEILHVHANDENSCIDEFPRSARSSLRETKSQVFNCDCR